MRWIVYLITHGGALAVGFALGIYLLPIITAPPPADIEQLQAAAQSAQFTGEFSRERAGSDFFHWAEGSISVSDDSIVHIGAMSPGPDYKLYLVKGFVEDAEGFNAVKASAKRIGDVKAFEGFELPVPKGVSVAQYDTIVIWCEAFGVYITSAQYQ